MKILAFDVRDDEKDIFNQIAATDNVDVTLSKKSPTVKDIEAVKGYEGISILGMTKLNKELLTHLKEAGVKYISTRTIGFDHIDVKAANELELKICNAAYPPNGVADFTVMMMLMCIRQYKQAMWRGQVNDFSLQGLQGRDLNTMTVGVMGTGRIGAQVIKNLSGFGCKIIAYDVHENDSIKSMATYVDLDTLYAQSDIITLHMPLLSSTEHIINNESLKKMKDGVILINCARGGLTDINTLVEGIESQKIGALGIDTVEGEETIVHLDRRTDIIPNRNWFYLHQFRNVIMTQHMAFYTREAVESMVRCGIEGIVEMANSGTYRTMITK